MFRMHFAYLHRIRRWEYSRRFAWPVFIFGVWSACVDGVPFGSFIGIRTYTG